MSNLSKETFIKLAGNSFDELEQRLKLLHQSDFDDATIVLLRKNIIDRVMTFIDRCYGKNLQMMSVMEVREIVTICYQMLLVGCNIQKQNKEKS